MARKRTGASDETRAKMAEAQKRRWADPAAHEGARAKWKERTGTSETQGELAARIGISTRKLKRVLSANRRGAPALFEAWDKGMVSGRTLERLLALPAELQDAIARDPRAARLIAGSVDLDALRERLKQGGEALDAESWVKLLFEMWTRSGDELGETLFVAPAEAQGAFLRAIDTWMKQFPAAPQHDRPNRRASKRKKAP
jgi:hypothetical protein